MNLPIPSVVFKYFAADPTGPMWNVSRAMKVAPETVVSGLRSLFDAISSDEVLEVRNDALFQHICDGSLDSDRAARIWITERCLLREIARRKLMLVRNEAEKLRPTPYDLPAIADVPVDTDHLVPLSAFRYDGSRLLRNGYAFNLLTTTPSPNSSYWLLGNLYSQKLETQSSVRLDPFLLGPEEQFPAMFYRMWQYGRPLDWERLRHLREVEHGRWFPGSLSRESQFTDFCWTPRPDGIHFLGEEVPKGQDCGYQPSRYLHAICDPTSENIKHFDGALRIFTSEELGHRHNSHVRNAGKVGVREKVFRLTSPIHRRAFSAVAQGFFVWNEDVRRYFTQELALQCPPLS